MEIIKSKRKATDIQISSTGTKAIEIPAALSRGKALSHLKDYEEVHGGRMAAIPSSEATNLLYRMFMKIGATKELPSIDSEAEMYLNDFWVDLYFRNNLCPGDIPFPIIISEFTTAMVQGKVQRRGNNQEAICEAFNEWITRENVRHDLYAIRNRMYPAGKPQQIAEQSQEKELKDYTDSELSEQLEKTNQVIKQFEGLKFPLEWKAKVEAEIARRTK